LHKCYNGKNILLFHMIKERMFYRQKYLNQIKNDLKKEKIILLIGSRQVGKTTILNMLEQELDSKKLYLNLEDYFWEDFKTKDEFVSFLSFEKWFDLYEDWYLFLDEVQYLKNPESLLKSLYDDKEIKVKIIATGSRFWGQKRVGSSLVWRWKIIFIKTFSFLEFLEAKGKKVDNLVNIKFSFLEKYLQEYLIFWGYPAVVFSETKEEKIRQLKRIIDRFLEKDFLYFMKSDDLINFKKVFQYLALNIWNIIKVWKITDVLWVSKYKVKQFLQFLSDSYLIKEIPPFYTDKSKEYNSQNELFFLDLGLLNYIRWNFEISFTDWKITENFVLLNLLDINLENNIYYYNKKNWTEIDFILEKLDKKIIPIEVKSANKFIKPKAFFSFYEEYKQIIDKFIVTTKSEKYIEKFFDKEIIFVPAYLINWY